MGAVSAIMQFLFILGLLLIIISVVQTNKSSAAPKTIYKYVPRSFMEEQENPVPLDDTFYNMFNDKTPWVASVDVDRRRNDIGENLNRYYVTQI